MEKSAKSVLAEEPRDVPVQNPMDFEVEKVDLTPLVNEVERLTGIRPTFSVTPSRGRGNSMHVHLQSEDIADKIGPFGAALRNVQLTTFNSSVVVEKDTKKLMWGGNIQFSYEHWGGGSNGAKILNFEYDTVTKTWMFSNERQIRLDYEKEHPPTTW